MAIKKNLMKFFQYPEPSLQGKILVWDHIGKYVNISISETTELIEPQYYTLNGSLQSLYFMLIKNTK